MHGVFAAKSGWGKSWYLQAWMETNAPRYDYFVCLDYADEYRGLVKSGLATLFIVGPKEAENFGVQDWKRMLRANPQLILARYQVDSDTWREEVAQPVITAARDLATESPDASSLTVIDEAHWVAPQQGNLPNIIKGMATGGRSEGCSSMWATQQLQELEERIIGNVMFQIIGGYSTSGDLNKVGSAVEYPQEFHNPTARDLPTAVPDELKVDGESRPVRKYTKGSGEDEITVGSEWIHSDDRGDIRRVDTRDVQMEATHYGDEGMKLIPPSKREDL